MSANPPHRFTRYVALGDSSTEGIDDPDGQGGYRGWSERLAERIASGGHGLMYANLAIRGLRTREVLERQLAPALAMRPDLASVFCGTNDVTHRRFDPGQLAADIEHMQRRLREQGATVISFTLPDLTPVMPLARWIAPRVRALNQSLARASASSGALLVDFAAYPVATDPRLWSEDRIHANAAGHARIADALAHALGLHDDDRWKRPLPPPPPRGLAASWAAEAGWWARHLAPWVLQGLAGRRAADGRCPKRPELTPFVPRPFPGA
jgi:lysophospholipase L1-like esterase